MDAKCYKEISAEMAGMLRNAGASFQILYHGNLDQYVWTDWDYEHNRWRPEQYPHDLFRVEVE